MYRYLFFDADGTLFDFDEAERRAMRLMGSEVGLRFTDEQLDCYQRANISCWKAFERGELTLAQLKNERFARFNSACGLSLDPEESSRRYQRQLSRQGILYDDAIAVLTALKERGYTLYLASNGIAEVQRGRIEEANVAHFFDAIFISEEMGVQKPDVRYFAMMLRHTDLTEHKEACLMIGDSLTSDIRGGMDSGLDTLWLNVKGERGPIPPPTHTVASLIEILALLTAPR